MSAFAAMLLLAAGVARAQLSSSAYRVLGQPDFSQNGVNRVEGRELNTPVGLALDARDGAVHLYIADTRNNRVMAWKDASTYQTGAAPDLVLGQASPSGSAVMAIGAKGFSMPVSMAADPLTGNLYVADFNNSRVLRFAAPFANPTRVEPDAVYGQPDFTTGTGNTGGISNTSLYLPRGVAVDGLGNLWVADSGNNRVLRFSAGVLNQPGAGADLVIGQADFSGGSANRASALSASGFNLPLGLAFDPAGSLYVSDYSNARVLRFDAPFGPDAAAAAVFGQSDFASTGAPASGTRMVGPFGLTVDGAGRLCVSDSGDNRVLIFPAGAASGSAAAQALGQPDLVSVKPNAGAFPLASATSLAAPADVKADSSGNLYVADSANNRVLMFPANANSASLVWGQPDFTSNGVNQIKAESVRIPLKIAVDYSQAPFALYLSDTGNHRVLAWKDAAHFHSGDPADLVIGQPDFHTAVANVDSGGLTPTAASLSGPGGIVVDGSGNLYVADAGNNRVLRYPRPVGQAGRIAADLVLGQADFTSASTTLVNAASLNTPRSVALGPDGNIFVSDAGNHRVLEFPAGSATGASAVRVYGQPAFESSATPDTPSAQNLAGPAGLVVDASYNLYVADANGNRVLIYLATRDAPAEGTGASLVIGQPGFDTAAAGLSAAQLNFPFDVALDSAANIYVADTGNNRVLIFPSVLTLPLSGGSATGVFGQKNFAGGAANWNGSGSLATAEGLSQPYGIFLDRMDTLYVADGANNRMVHVLKTVSVVSSALQQAGGTVARGSLATLGGSGLTGSTENAPAPPLPLALGGREVVVNEQLRAPLLAAGGDQIKFQVPSDAPLGADRIAVRTADTEELIAGGSFLVSVASPGLFTTGDGSGQARASNQDKSANGASSAASRGSTITLYGTGQGPVSPAVPDGTPAPGGAQTVATPTTDGLTCLRTQPSVCVAIGTTFGEIQFSGLQPGAVGIWQLDVKIPSSAPVGSAVPLRAVINGMPTNIVTIAIR